MRNQDGPNEIIHQSLRLRVMATLCAQPRGEQLEFMELKAITQATDGNIGAHLATLEKAGYVAVQKDFVGKKARTRITATRAGRRAFEQHVEFLRATLEGVLED